MAVSDKKDKKEEKKFKRFLRKSAKKTKGISRERFEKSGRLQTGADLMGRRKERRGQGSDEGRTSEVGNAVGEKNRLKGARKRSVKKTFVDKRDQPVRKSPDIKESSYDRKPLVEYGTVKGEKLVQKTSGRVGEGKLDEARSKGGSFKNTGAADSAAKKADTAEGKTVTQKTYSGAKPEKNTGLLRGKQEGPKTNEEKAQERSRVYSFKDKGKDKNFLKLRKGKIRNTGKLKKSKAKHVYKFSSKQARKDFMDNGGEKKVMEAFDSDAARKSMRAGDIKKRGRKIVVKGKARRNRSGSGGMYDAKKVR